MTKKNQDPNAEIWEEIREIPFYTDEGEGLTLTNEGRRRYEEDRKRREACAAKPKPSAVKADKAAKKWKAEKTKANRKGLKSAVHEHIKQGGTAEQLKGEAKKEAMRQQAEAEAARMQKPTFKAIIDRGENEEAITKTSLESLEKALRFREQAEGAPLKYEIIEEPRESRQAEHLEEEAIKEANKCHYKAIRGKRQPKATARLKAEAYRRAGGRHRLPKQSEAKAAESGAVPEA